MPPPTDDGLRGEDAPGAPALAPAPAAPVGVLAGTRPTLWVVVVPPAAGAPAAPVPVAGAGAAGVLVVKLTCGTVTALVTVDVWLEVVMVWV